MWMSRLREMRGGRENDSEFGTRFRGNACLPICWSSRFRIPASGWGLNRDECGWMFSRFRPPARGGQYGVVRLSVDSGIAQRGLNDCPCRVQLYHSLCQ